MSAVSTTPESFREELSSLPGDWFIVRTFTSHERKVKGNMLARVTSGYMEDSIFQVEVPMVTVRVVKGDKISLVTQPKYPGYVLVRADLEVPGTFQTIRQTPGVTGFLGANNIPQPLTLDEAADMLLPESVDEVDKPAVAAPAASAFRVGQAVTITGGAFSTMPATVTDIDGDRVSVMVNIFGRDTPVELESSQVSAD